MQLLRCHFSSLGSLHTKSKMSETTVHKNGVLRRVDKIIKSAQDKRNYRGLELANHMKVLLVSDPETDKSAASMDVNIGKALNISDIHIF